MPKFLVWDAEYPEEGSTMYDVPTREDAMTAYRQDSGPGWEETELGCSEATPEQIAIHEKDEG